jgi:hypothetical protein
VCLSPPPEELGDGGVGSSPLQAYTLAEGRACTGCNAAGHASPMVNHNPEEPTMKLYSAADLHSNNHFLTIIDEQDRRILEKRLPNDLAVTLRTLEPYRAELVGVAVESTFYPCLEFRRGWPMIGGKSPFLRPPAGLRASHNYKLSRNASTRAVGLYRCCLIFGVCKVLRARSFIAKSASMYICVVAGLSWPNHSAITVKSTPD